MRVIAGEYRSRLLQAPRGTETRPTSDRLRETLFNVIAIRVAGAKFADLYAGSGAVGIEAISRGAEFVWFAEKALPAVKAIRTNLAALKIAGGFALEDRGVGRLLAELGKKGTKPDLVFVDPPYEATGEYARTLGTLGSEDVLAAGAMVVVEHTRKFTLENAYGRLKKTRVLEQGDAGLSFYSVG